MLYRHRPAPPQVRLQCRNPRCGGNLKIPAANPRDAFCCKGCEGRFYSCRCRVCEQLFSRKTTRRQVCGRDQCRYAFKANPRRFSSSSITPQNSKISHNAFANPTKRDPKRRQSRSGMANNCQANRTSTR